MVSFIAAFCWSMHGISTIPYHYLFGYATVITIMSVLNKQTNKKYFCLHFSLHATGGCLSVFNHISRVWNIAGVASHSHSAHVLTPHRIETYNKLRARDFKSSKNKTVGEGNHNFNMKHVLKKETKSYENQTKSDLLFSTSKVQSWNI